MHSLSLLTLAVAAGSAFAHIEMSHPAPFRSRHGSGGNVDYSMTSPLLADGSDFPCKGYHHDSVSKPSATYKAGGSGDIKLEGTATHGGGSCQISLSYDQGNTFRVIESIIGGCPLNKQYGFKIPSNAPSGEALLAWTWFNKIGNREMYMNCAPVVIEGGNGDRAAFDKLPEIYIANVGNGKTTIEGEDVQFPNPGEGSSGRDAPPSTPSPSSPSASPTPAVTAPALQVDPNAASTLSPSPSPSSSSASPIPAVTAPALQVDPNAASTLSPSPSPSPSAPASGSGIQFSGVASGIGATGSLPLSCSCECSTS
ncbi:hypothetical protein ACJ73_05663 [Blastomyces percursus]|uniref:DNA-directed RNA polymerase n=1 Tax=Blastomyces percursus TaxID=1658174 RepID=A0A1J9Q2X4_9EURO|nr:hypothetical protein ACJ73_05663 [Blastomyces percursus]